MAKGLSVHIGINHLDPAYYGAVNPLKAAVKDARDWKKFAKSKGFATKILTNETATTHAFKDTIARWGKKAVSGDLLLITYSGHGNQMENDRQTIINNERFNQTWCLYDKELLDDEIYECLCAFEKGVRIVIISDSCHSGTVARAEDKFQIDLNAALGIGLNTMAEARGFRARSLPKVGPDEIDAKVAFKEDYQKLFDYFRSQPQVKLVKASVKLLAACLDEQVTFDGKKNGLFTGTLMKVLRDGEEKQKTAEELIRSTKDRYNTIIPTPHFFQFGSIISSFDEHSPFQIDIPNATTVTGERIPDLSNVDVGQPSAELSTGGMFQPAILKVMIKGEAKEDLLVSTTDRIQILDYRKEGNYGIWQIRLSNLPFNKAWKSAHALQTAISAEGYAAQVEPVLSFNPAPNSGGALVAREGNPENPDYYENWPPAFYDPKVNIGWHLDNEHTQLAEARERVLSKNPSAHIRIAHIDTGYFEGHPSLPGNLKHELGRNFVDPKRTTFALDEKGSGQDGHGLATIILLAGGEVRSDYIFNEFKGVMGGVPFAEVVPIRISESVAILNTDNFCRALQHAMDMECDVVTMSMAGKPSREMARKINEAYERGIVIVSAASNCWFKDIGTILPKCVLYPAAFHRVIAAVGATYEHKPYDQEFMLNDRVFNLDSAYMQGCWGPASRMTRALAAYTPNSPWAVIDKPYDFTRSGGGTSSATPQIAAAAALWIAYYREELESLKYYEKGNRWMIVEAVRNALFSQAYKPETPDFNQWKTYYGNGILRASSALNVPPPASPHFEKSPEAKSSIGGILETATAFFKNRRWFRELEIQPSEEALADELLDLLYVDPEFKHEIESLDLSDASQCRRMLADRAFRAKVAYSEYASDYLKASMNEAEE